MRRTVSISHALNGLLLCVFCSVPAFAMPGLERAAVFPNVAPLAPPRAIQAETPVAVDATGEDAAPPGMLGHKPAPINPRSLFASLSQRDRLTLPSPSETIPVPELALPRLPDSGTTLAAKPVAEEPDEPEAVAESTPEAQPEVAAREPEPEPHVQTRPDLSILESLSGVQAPVVETPEAASPAEAEAPPVETIAETTQVASLTPRTSPAPVPNLDAPTLREDPLAIDLTNPPDDKSAKAITQFRAFASEWVAKINRTYTNSRERMEIVELDGRFIARYTFAPEESLAIQVKRSEYDHTPFVGVMRYNEITYEAEGASPEEAQSNEFVAVKVMKVTEIFRYASNNWIY